jgi:amino acid transporter
VSVPLLLIVQTPFIVFGSRSYLPIPLFGALWLGYKLRFGTRLIPASKVDLVTGKREIDEEEERFVLLEKARQAKTSRWRRLADIL